MKRTFATRTRALGLPEDRPTLRQLTEVRWSLLLSALALVAVGLLTIHSASSELPVDYLPRQALWVTLGVASMLLAFTVDYRALLRVAPVLFGIACLTLVVILFVGTERGGARSWIGLGAFGVQPSEFAMIATALLLARHLGHQNQRLLRFSQVVTAVGLTLVPLVLVVLERDLGNALMFTPILAGMLLVAGLDWRLLAVGALLLALALGVAWSFLLLDYQKERVVSFLAPGSDPLGAGYQLRQSKIAVGSGQLTGRGYMQGTQSQLRFLPARHTDFVFAVLAEEWGFLGVLGVLGLYAAYVLNGARVALRARDRAGTFLVVGLLSGFAFHVLYNTAMVVGLVPITGIPVPFLSYGGSFTLANFIATGLILGVDFRRYVNR